MGVRVLNIGLNGVLVTEKETERSIFLYAEPWAEPTRRPFFAVGTCEATGTDHSSPGDHPDRRPGGLAEVARRGHARRRPITATIEARSMEVPDEPMSARQRIASLPPDEAKDGDETFSWLSCFCTGCGGISS